MRATTVDFLGFKFKTYKCSRCRKQHTRLAWDKDSSYTCPKCTNKESIDDEKASL